MNRAFKTRQVINHTSLHTKREVKADRLAVTAKKCREVIEACYKYRCKECYGVVGHCYCLAA